MNDKRHYTWAEFIAGRPARRRISERIAPEGCRRQSGHPEDDARLRALNGGERGPAFTSTEGLERAAAESEGSVTVQENGGGGKAGDP